MATSNGTMERTMEKNKTWKQELARDFLALGSWIFYILVIARASIVPYRPFLDQLIIAAIPIIAFQLFLKKPDYYIARVVPLAVFTIIFYNSSSFTIFAIIIGLLMIPASHIAKNHKIEIFYGLILGAIAAAIGYYVPMLY